MTARTARHISLVAATSSNVLKYKKKFFLSFAHIAHKSWAEMCVFITNLNANDRHQFQIRYAKVHYLAGVELSTTIDDVTVNPV